MKVLPRLALLLLAGLSLAGCTTTTASRTPPPAPASPKIASTWGEEPMSGRDHWMMRDLNDRYDRIRNQP